MSVFGAGALFFRAEEGVFARPIAPLFFACLRFTAVDLDFHLFLAPSMPGMLCMSCPWCCAQVTTPPAANSNTTASAHNLAFTLPVKVRELIIAFPLKG
jgi:hypothetical protein